LQNYQAYTEYRTKLKKVYIRYCALITQNLINLKLNYSKHVKIDCCYFALLYKRVHYFNPIISIRFFMLLFL